MAANIADRAAPPPRRGRRVNAVNQPGSCGPASAAARSASTVSPAIAVWPSATSGPAALRQIDVDARAEPDHADAVAGRDRLPLLHEGHDPPRDQAGDLHHADAGAAASR